MTAIHKLFVVRAALAVAAASLSLTVLSQSPEADVNGTIATSATEPVTDAKNNNGWQ